MGKYAVAYMVLIFNSIQNESTCIISCIFNKLKFVSWWMSINSVLTCVCIFDKTFFFSRKIYFYKILFNSKCSEQYSFELDLEIETHLSWLKWKFLYCYESTLLRVALKWVETNHSMGKILQCLSWFVCSVVWQLFRQTKLKVLMNASIFGSEVFQLAFVVSFMKSWFGNRQNYMSFLTIWPTLLMKVSNRICMNFKSKYFHLIFGNCSFV